MANIFKIVVYSYHIFPLIALYLIILGVFLKISPQESHQKNKTVEIPTFFWWRTTFATFCGSLLRDTAYSRPSPFALQNCTVAKATQFWDGTFSPTSWLLVPVLSPTLKMRIHMNAHFVLAEDMGLELLNFVPHYSQCS